MPHVTVGGQRLFYLRRAADGQSGPVVLLLHGAGGNALLWGRVLNALPGVNAIALDLPGHGRSAGPGRSSIAAYCDDVLGLAERLHLDDLVLAGHSMGGAVALDVALRQPSRLRALVLMSVAARLFVAPALLQQLVEDPAKARQWIIDTGYGPQTLAEARELGARQLAEVAPEVLHGDFFACSVYDARLRLSEVGRPALVLCGAEDRLTPPSCVRALQEGLPAAYLELVPCAGPMLPLECPQAGAGAMGRFLSSLGTPKRSECQA